jgi:exonuclease SbcD
MRLIHTADWHLGQTLRGYRRDPEHTAALEQLVSLTEAHQPDAFLIAGDVFDTSNPTPEAQQLYYRTLGQLRRAAPHMAIIVTAGNHDAAGRLAAPRTLLAELNVHVIGYARSADHLVAIRNARGVLLGHVLAVSFPTAPCLPAGHAKLADAVAALYAELAQPQRHRWEGLPLVVTGHLHVAGGTETGGSERSLLIGGESAVPTSVFPAEASYVALGHLHKAQQVGAGPVYYSGSLIPLSASEADYTHGVNLVSLRSGSVSVERLPLKRPRGFIRLPLLTLPETLSRLRTLEGEPFVQVSLRRQGLPADFREQLDAVRGVRLVELKLEETEAMRVARHEAPQDRVADLNPEHFFALAFEKRHGRKPEPAHNEAFAALLRKLS